VFYRTSLSSVPKTQFLDDLARFLQQEWVGWSEVIAGQYVKKNIILIPSIIEPFEENS